MALKEPRTPAGPAPCLHPNRRACIQRSISPAPPHPGATPTPHVETTTWRAGRPSGVTGQAPARGQEGRGPQDHRLLLGRSPPSSSLRLCSLSVLGSARQACTSPQVCTRLPGCAHISPGVHRSPQVCTHLPGCAHVSPGVNTSPQVLTCLPGCSRVSPGAHTGAHRAIPRASRGQQPLQLPASALGSSGPMDPGGTGRADQRDIGASPQGCQGPCFEWRPISRKQPTEGPPALTLKASPGGRGPH